MKGFLLIINLFLMTTFVLAMDCQYTEIETYQEKGFFLYYGDSDDYFGEGLNISNFQGGYGNIAESCKYSFIVHNPFKEDITLQIKYYVYMPALNYFHGEIKEQHIETITIEGLSYHKISGEWGGIGSCRVIPDEITYKIIEPYVLTYKMGILQKNRTICKRCLGKPCLNDGEVCSDPRECGGGYCVEGHCSNSEKCYNNDCKCAPDEIQCDDNKRCVPRNKIALDSKPICGKNEECISGYIDPNTLLCAKSPSQIQKEKDERNKLLIISIIIFAFITVVGIISFFSLKNKNEEEKQKTELAKQKTIEKQKELFFTQLNSKDMELEKIKNEIRELESHKRIKEHELKKLKNLKEKGSKLYNEIVLMEQQINEKWQNLKPFPDPQANNRLVIINPYLGGYKCFYNKKLELTEYPISSLVHRWVWKQKTGRWPRYGYHIHHIDGNKYNNDPNNLEEVEGEEHYEKHMG